MLGCLNTAQLRIVRRDSQVIWESLPSVSDAISASWNRIVDDVSTASFVIALGDEGCCPPFIHVVADRIEYIRNGVVEWVGTVTRFSETGNDLAIDAVDLLGEYSARVIHSDIALASTELTAQIDAIRADADSVDPVPLIWSSFPTGISTDLTIAAADYRKAKDVIIEIAGAGMDITAVGRRVWYGDLSATGLRSIVITPQMIRGVPLLGEAGEGVATRVIATNGSGLSAVYPPGSPVVDPRYGLREIVLDFTDVTDLTLLQETAEAEYLERSRVPRFLAFSEGAWLDEDFPYRLGELIPGRIARVDVRGECGAIAQDMRISQLTYQVEQGQERIRLEVAPTGTVFPGEQT